MLFNNLIADDTTDYPRIMGAAGMRDADDESRRGYQYAM